MDIIKTCKEFPSVGDKFDPNCSYLFATDIILVRKIAKGAFGIVYEIKIVDPEGRYALKINNLNSNTITELKIDCMVDEIRNVYSDCIIGINRWFLCKKPPQNWHLIEIPTVLRDAWEFDRTLLYFIMNLAETSLEKLDIPLTEYDITCILFELFYTLLVLQTKFNLSHNDIKPDNILFSIATYARRYIIGDKEYYIKSPYLPMLSDFGLAKVDSLPEEAGGDILNLLTSISDYANDHVELTEKYIEEITEFNESLENGILYGLQSRMFSNLTEDKGKAFKKIKNFSQLF